MSTLIRFASFATFDPRCFMFLWVAELNVDEDFGLDRFY